MRQKSPNVAVKFAATLPKCFPTFHKLGKGTGPGLRPLAFVVEVHGHEGGALLVVPKVTVHKTVLKTIHGDIGIHETILIAWFLDWCPEWPCTKPN